MRKTALSNLHLPKTSFQIFCHSNNYIHINRFTFINRRSLHRQWFERDYQADITSDLKISFKSLSWQQLFTIWQLTIGEELVAESKVRKRDHINLKSDANLPFKFLPQRHFLDILIVTNWRIVTIPKNQLVIEFHCLTLLVLWERNNSFFFLLFFLRQVDKKTLSQSILYFFILAAVGT